MSATGNVRPARRESLVAIACAVLACAFVSSLHFGWSYLGDPRVMVAAVAGVILLGVVARYRVGLGILREAGYRRLARATREGAEAGLGLRILWVLLAAMFYFDGAWTPGDIGVSSRLPPWLCLALGAVAFLPVSYAMRATAKTKGDPRRHAREWLNTMGALQPRARRGRCVEFLSTLLNPFTEEFAYRGVLVFMLARQGAPWLLAFLLGAGACLWAHLYQGRGRLGAHFVFYVSAVACLYSPGGLWSAIGLHFAGDLVPVVGLRGTMRSIRRLPRTSLRRPRPTTTTA